MITGTSGTRAIRTKYPYVKGLIAETTSQTGNTENLTPQEKFVGNKVSIKDAVIIDNALLLENNDFILLENGDYIEVEV